MNQKVVAFTGISGVGKTTFLRKLAERIDFQHVTGGSLIAAARAAAPGSRDAIRYANLDENQILLVKGFLLARDRKSNLVVMDGHVIIDDGAALSKISSEVFKALGVTVMAHLECTPERIAQNRIEDKSRARPTYPSSTLQRHQEISRTHAQAIATMLGVPFYSVTHNDVNWLARHLVAE